MQQAAPAKEGRINAVRRDIEKYKSSGLPRDASLAYAQVLYQSIDSLIPDEPGLSEAVLDGLRAEVKETEDSYRAMWGPRDTITTKRPEARSRRGFHNRTSKP